MEFITKFICNKQKDKVNNYKKFELLDIKQAGTFDFLLLNEPENVLFELMHGKIIVLVQISILILDLEINCL